MMKQPTKKQVKALLESSGKDGVVFAQFFNKTGKAEAAFFQSIDRSGANKMLDLFLPPTRPRSLSEAHREAKGKDRMKRGGFTLIELLVVVIVISVLLAVFLPALASAKRMGKITRCRTSMHDVAVAFASHRADHAGVWPDNFPALDLGDKVPLCAVDPNHAPFRLALGTNFAPVVDHFPASRFAVVCDQSPSPDHWDAGYADGHVGPYEMLMLGNVSVGVETGEGGEGGEGETP